MSVRKYCPMCQRNVEARKKKFGIFAFWFTGFVPYLIYHACKKPQCPVCGCKTLEKAKGEAEIKQIRNGQFCNDFLVARLTPYKRVFYMQKSI